MDTILLVEDNEQIMEINEWYLSRHGYQIEKAYTVAQARESLRHASPDLVILDVLLPDGDGLSFCAEIRKTHSIPILFLTGVVADQDMMTAYRCGGNDYITKPYDLEMLGVRVEALLTYAKGLCPKGQDHTFGPLRFDIIQSEAFVDDEPLNLSRNEFRLLYALAQCNGEAIPKEALFRKVWGMETGADGPMLWTAVSRLKKKIAPYADRFYLDSDHSGYALILPRQQEANK